MTSISMNPLNPANVANTAVGIHCQPGSHFARPAKSRARPPSP
jgi:hypothetical protein